MGHRYPHPTLMKGPWVRAQGRPSSRADPEAAGCPEPIPTAGLPGAAGPAWLLPGPWGGLGTLSVSRDQGPPQPHAAASCAATGWGTSHWGTRVSRLLGCSWQGPERGQGGYTPRTGTEPCGSPRPLSPPGAPLPPSHTSGRRSLSRLRRTLQPDREFQSNGAREAPRQADPARTQPSPAETRGPEAHGCLRGSGKQSALRRDGAAPGFQTPEERSPGQGPPAMGEPCPSGREGSSRWGCSQDW